MRRLPHRISRIPRLLSRVICQQQLKHTHEVKPHQICEKLFVWGDTEVRLNFSHGDGEIVLCIANGPSSARASNLIWIHSLRNLASVDVIDVSYQSLEACSCDSLVALRSHLRHHCRCQPWFPRHRCQKGFPESHPERFKNGRGRHLGKSTAPWWKLIWFSKPPCPPRVLAVLWVLPVRGSELAITRSLIIIYY